MCSVCSVLDDDLLRHLVLELLDVDRELEGIGIAVEEQLVALLVIADIAVVERVTGVD